MRAASVLLVLVVVLAVPAAAHTNHVSADSQVSADGTVVVEAMYPADDVWVAIHLDDDGDPGRVVGHRRVSGGSFHADVPVSIENEAWANWTDSRKIHVVFHRPNGDGEFDAETDEPLSSFDDLVAAQLVLGKGRPARLTAEAFGPEQVDANAVTLRSAVLPEDGYVVLRNDSADGEIVGHAALEAGSHETVRVTFDDAFYHDQGEQFQLHASIAMDDGDGEFDAGDRRLTVGAKPVGTLLSVQKTESADHDHETTTTAGTTEAATSTTTAGTTPASGEQGGASGFGLALALLALVASVGVRRCR